MIIDNEQLLKFINQIVLPQPQLFCSTPKILFVIVTTAGQYMIEDLYFKILGKIVSQPGFSPTIVILKIYTSNNINMNHS